MRKPLVDPKSGEWLRFFREDAGLTQRELAKDAGVSYVHINHLENARRRPTAPVKKAISLALDVPQRDLFPENGTPSPGDIVWDYLNHKGKKR